MFSECFVNVLALAQELGCLKQLGGISVDGTKIKANASKHAVVSYKRLEKVSIEWDIVTTAYNLKRLFKMTGGTSLSGNSKLITVNT